MVLEQNNLPEGCTLNECRCNDCEGLNLCELATPGGHCVICSGCQSCFTVKDWVRAECHDAWVLGHATRISDLDAGRV